jgi:hypothetical protein
VTIDRFQAIVLRLGNQMFVRHYLWLNYPQDPQLMGIDFMASIPTNRRKPKPISCDCGRCEKCKHRNYMRGQRPTSRLETELLEAGFSFSESHGMWTIERTDAA